MDDNDKLKELMKLSNSAKVIKKAIKYFNHPNIKIDVRKIKYI